MFGLKHKLRGFTLVETLISLVIILSVFAIGMMIMVNIIKTSRHQQRLESLVIVNEVYANALTNKWFTDETILYNGFKIEKKFFPRKDYDSLVVMRIRLLDEDGKVLSERIEIIINPLADETLW